MKKIIAAVVIFVSMLSAQDNNLIFGLKAGVEEIGGNNPDERKLELFFKKVLYTFNDTSGEIDLALLQEYNLWAKSVDKEFYHKYLYALYLYSKKLKLRNYILEFEYKKEENKENEPDKVFDYNIDAKKLVLKNEINRNIKNILFNDSLIKENNFRPLGLIITLPTLEEFLSMNLNLKRYKEDLKVKRLAKDDLDDAYISAYVSNTSTDYSGNKSSDNHSDALLTYYHVYDKKPSQRDRLAFIKAQKKLKLAKRQEIFLYKNIKNKVRDLNDQINAENKLIESNDKYSKSDNLYNYLRENALLDIEISKIKKEEFKLQITFQLMELWSSMELKFD